MAVVTMATVTSDGGLARLIDRFGRPARSTTGCDAGAKLSQCTHGACSYASECKCTMRVQSHLVLGYRCGVFGGESETIDHLFRLCSTSYATWLCVVIQPSRAHEFFSMEFMDWLRYNITSNAFVVSNDVEWPLLFGLVLWSLWLNYNRLIVDMQNAGNEFVLMMSRHMNGEYNFTS
ncbi:hypothetical protein V6N12_046387 [Hibiscus sabdariffa]|uniref:Uncharacterized protein n=1 Tax=Hibiscus sabdariffa TaxID=183260 RepID=A0ABR2DLE5_9ROSI